MHAAASAHPVLRWLLAACMVGLGMSAPRGVVLCFAQSGHIAVEAPHPGGGCADAHQATCADTTCLGEAPCSDLTISLPLTLLTTATESFVPPAPIACISPPPADEAWTDACTVRPAAARARGRPPDLARLRAVRLRL